MSAYATCRNTEDLFSPQPSMRTPQADARLVALTSRLVYLARHGGLSRADLLAQARSGIATLAIRHPEAITPDPLDYLLWHLNPHLLDAEAGSRAPLHSSEIVATVTNAAA